MKLSPILTRSKSKIEQWWKHSRHYQAPLDPYRIIWIDPSLVKDREKKVIEKSERHLSHVIGGDWDQNQIPFKRRTLFQSMKRRYLHDTPWSDTKHYANVLQRINEGESTWHNCSSKEELDERCEFIDTLYNSISESGYKTHHEMRAIPPRVPLEIKVGVGRDGDYYYVNGKHRLSIAKILKLDAIPVHVMLRHSQWQTVRDEIVTTWNGEEKLSEKAKTYLTHPDIRYLRI